MSQLVATGCAHCNPTIAYAEGAMPLHPRVLTGEMYVRMRPRRRVFLDGEDQSGKEVVACILGPQGWVLRNHITRMFGLEGHHLCYCGSQYAAVELWRGSVELG